jgi:hypothetical protein
LLVWIASLSFKRKMSKLTAVLGRVEYSERVNLT